MDVDRIYQLLGTAFKRVYGFYVKRPLQRFNVDNRAEKVMETQKSIPKVAPRHERTDQLFKQITQNNPHLKEELNAKREDLLKRLSSVKVVSKDIQMSDKELEEMEEIKQKYRNRLPNSREGTEIPIHAYVEPQFVPKGRISLIRALDFIGKHSKSPEEYDSQTIAKQHNMSEEDVKNILDYFKPFYRDNITEPVADTEKVLGISAAKVFGQITSFLRPKSQVTNEQIDSTSADKSADRPQSQQTDEKIKKSVNDRK